MQTRAAVDLDDSVQPAWEWVCGRALQKMSPTNLHSFLQREFASRLGSWASGHGRVGTEWRFLVPPNPYDTESVVPDVAYLSNARYLALPKVERTYPTIAPEIVVEVLSPTDRATDVEAKRRTYLWWGVELVIVADPETRTVELFDCDGRFASRTENDMLTHLRFPTLAMDLRDVFAALDEPD